MLLAENIALQVTSRTNDGALASKDLQLAQLNLHCSALTLERDEQREEVSTLRARNDTLQAELRDLNVAVQLTVCCLTIFRMCNLKFLIKFLSGDNNMHLLLFIPLFVM